MRNIRMQSIRERNNYFYLTDSKQEKPFNSLKEIIQDALDNKRPMDFLQVYKSEYSEFTTPVASNIIRQYLKFMKKI